MSNSYVLCQWQSKHSLARSIRCPCFGTKRTRKHEMHTTFAARGCVSRRTSKLKKESCHSGVKRVSYFWDSLLEATHGIQECGQTFCDHAGKAGPNTRLACNGRSRQSPVRSTVIYCKNRRTWSMHNRNTRSVEEIARADACVALLRLFLYGRRFGQQRAA